MLAHQSVTNAVQHITVVLDETQDGLKKKFHCPACGGTVFQYYGAIKLIAPGDSEYELPTPDGKPLVIACKNKRRLIRDNGEEVDSKCKVILDVIG